MAENYKNKTYSQLLGTSLIIGNCLIHHKSKIKFDSETNTLHSHAAWTPSLSRQGFSLKEHPFLKPPSETFRQFLKLIQGWTPKAGREVFGFRNHKALKYQIYWIRHTKKVSYVLKTAVATKQYSFYYASYYANFFIQKQSLSVVYDASSWEAPVFSKRKYLSVTDQSQQPMKCPWKPGGIVISSL